MPIAVVTGSDTGIGEATAVILAERGWDIGITYRSNAEGAEDVAERVRQAGRRVAVRQMDLSVLPDATEAVRELADELGGLHALVNNAGMMRSEPFLDMSLASWQQQIDVDLTGAFLCAQKAARRMIDDGASGAIVNVTSVHQLVPKRDFTAYSPAKAALGMLGQQMALELAEHGIRVNNVAPGEVATSMGAGETEEVHRFERPGVPLGRPAHAREIGYAVAWLLSEEASFTTGATLVVDGGLTLMAAQQMGP